MTAVNRYFKKHRLIANIISTIGLTFGMAIYAAIVPLLNAAFGWNGTLLILGGIASNVCALACILFPTGSQDSTRKVLNMGLLKDKYFLLYGVQCLFCNLSSSMIFVHLPALILSFNLSTSIASFALTVYGLSNCFAKILHSIIGYFRHPDSSIIYTVSLSITGLVMLLIPASQDRMWIVFLVAVLGFMYSVTGGHHIEIIMHLVGQENASDGLGFGQIAKASGSLLAGPLAGEFTTNIKIYNTSTY